MKRQMRCSAASTTGGKLEVSLDSVALARLIEEIRKGRDGELYTPTAYNRTYHRHNR